MIRCVIFDFDGTLRQSVAIKHEAYFAAVRDIKRGEELFREIIREFLERFREVFANFRKVFAI